MNIIVYILTKGSKVLVEKYPKLDDTFLANQFVYPGGTIEEVELEDYALTLTREVQEELGIKPIEFSAVTNEPLRITADLSISPFLVTKWQGKIPKNILDEDQNPLFWKDINFMEKSPIASVKKITKKIKEYFKSHP